tara:strand:- start:2667 stop:2879 length:213 start_codon:yes stop_codon:yes gene_type:complete
MKYYIKNKVKNDFYLVGEIISSDFHKKHGYEFLESYIGEFPGLYNIVQIVDENDEEIKLYDFLNLINERF